MDHAVMFNYLSEDWKKLEKFNINGVPHWAGCYVVPLLGLKSTTWAIRGNKDNPKMHFPLYRKQRVPKITNRCNIYLLTVEGIVQVICKSRHPTCKSLKILLEKYGLIP